MTVSQAKRVAEVALRDFGNEREFVLQFPNEEDTRLIKEAFEGMGCSVVLSENSLRMTIRCAEPEG